MAEVLTGAFRPASALTICGLVATGCVSDERLGGPLAIEVAAPTPQAALQAIASGASRCWGSGAMDGYAAIPELDTEVGTPRILIVEKGGGGGLPSMVVEARPEPTRIRTYGPLTATALSDRINADIIRWSTGRGGCR